MALDDVFRDVVGICDDLFKPVQADVQHVTWVGQDALGDPLPPVVVIRKAIVEQKLQDIKLNDGRSVSIQAKLTFLAPVLPNGAPNRIEPIDARDTFILPDGSSGPVVNVSGMRDPGANRPFFLEVFLGA